MINRDNYINQVNRIFEIVPICAILGPRQCGKTTLALEYAKKFEKYHLFDLEDPSDRIKLENPKLTLEPLEGAIIIDEIQRLKDIFPYLRVLVDRKPKSKILILGSASRDLLEQSSETLAGRIAYIELTPFKLPEVGNMKQLWERGGFPKSYLAINEEASLFWRKSYINTFIERDIGTMGFNISSQEMRKFCMMLAHYHGNIMNYSEIGKSLAVSDVTVKRYLDILETLFVVRVLKPWYENIKKRQVKTPKIYIRDSGILHALLGIKGDEVRLHPKTGSSWEGFALEEVVHHLNAEKEDCYFWATHNNAELDLMICKDGKKIGIEFKYTDSPKITSSMRIALEELHLDELYIIIPLEENFLIAENVRVMGLKNFINYKKN